ncbi:polymorphic toxin-type HINT domain-containing protein [Streptomyces sp. NPDC058955]|uniref:polymorphic toxin-type HINT domain-containing protein n=1 Tax=unclassified Streptomyces TaxID=2593676 RepID=UPI00366451A7
MSARRLLPRGRRIVGLATGLVSAAALLVVPSATAGPPSEKVWVPPYTALGSGTPTVEGGPLRPTALPRPAYPVPASWVPQPQATRALPGSATVELGVDGAEASAARTATGGASPASGGGRPVRAGNLPVTLAPASGAAPRERRIDVTLADQAVGRRLGVSGPVLGLTERPAASAPQGRKAPGGTPSDRRIRVAVDLAAAGASGWLDRARLVALPACALTTPDRAECRTRRQVDAEVDLRARTLTADVTPASAPAPATTGGVQRASFTADTAGTAGTATVLAVENTASGTAGSYAATPLTSSSGWSASGNAGGFSYAYPVDVPPAIGGMTPSVALGYDSSGVDGRNSAQNPQSSWVGEGWGYDAGFIERSYKDCDKAGIPNSGDLCWGGHNAVLNLAGHSGTLVRDDDTGVWRLQNDDGTRVERLTGAANGLHDGEHWKVTTADGLRYYFGVEHLPGGDGTDPSAESAWGVPVYAPAAGDPCHTAASGTASWCRMGWRWNLDHVVDPYGNLVSYRYAKETNRYQRGAGQTNGAGVLEPYERGGHVQRIDYGRQLSEQIAAKGALVPGARVSFAVAERCKPSGAITCAEDQRTTANQSSWPDVPLDQLCGTTGTCANASPSFFTTKLLSAISTEVRVDAALTPVDTWTLRHDFPNPGDGTKPALWLSGITRKAGSGISALTLPEVAFTPRLLANRVDGMTPAQPSFNRPRIQTIRTETGGQITVGYADPVCSRVKGVMPASPDTNTKPCMPVKWRLPGSTSTEPVLDWFHTYLVAHVSEQDAVTGSLVKTTAYTYNGDVAWHRNDAEFTDAKYRTWDEFRGYATVDTVTGSAYPGEAPRTRQRTTFLRGMDGDVKADGTRRHVSVTSPLDGAGVTDSDWLAGTPLATEIFESADRDVVQSVTGRRTSGEKVTATRARSGGMPDLVARYSSTESVELAKDRLADGSWRTTSKVTKSDPDHANRSVTVEDRGDGTAATPTVCTTVRYATAEDGALTGLVAEKKTHQGGCDTTATAQNTLNASRTLFDGKPFGQAGTRGAPTGSLVLDRHTSGGAPVYAHVGSTSFDVHGRALTVTRADGSTYDEAGARLTPPTVTPAATTTAYTPATGALPVKVSTTGPMGEGWTETVTLDPARSTPLTTTDVNGRVTTMRYDALGRLTAVWNPERSTTLSPTARFGYRIDGVTGPSATTTETLAKDGKTYAAQIVLLDGLGRERQTQWTPASRATGRLVTDTVYDSHGWQVKTSAPYYDASSIPDTTVFLPGNDSQVPAQTWTEYDGVGRVVRAEFRSYGNAQWATATAYPGADRTDVTPPAGSAPVSTVTDARGRVTENWQYRTTTATGTRSDADVSRYAYTPGGLLASHTDSAGNTWRYGYDLRGRKVSAEDPDAGTTRTSYDIDSNVERTVDAKGRTLVHTYDVLGRMTARYKDGVAPADMLARWTYDTLPGAKGHPVASVRYVGGADGVAYTKSVTGYDKGYRPLGTTVDIPAEEGRLQGTYTTNYTYHPITGDVLTMALPAAGDLAAETVGYTYNNHGLLSTSRSLDENLVAAMEYDALSRPVRTTVGELGAQVVSTQQYDWATGRLIASFLDREGGTVSTDQYSYTYTPSGRITSITDRQEATAVDAQCFTYDHLGRLTRAWTDTGGVRTTADWTDSAGTVHGTGSSAHVPGTGSCVNATGPATTPTGTRTVGGPSPYWQSYAYDATGNRRSLTRHDITGDSAKDVVTTQTFATGPNQKTTAGGTGGGTGGPHALLTSTTVTPGSPDEAIGYQYDATGNTTAITDRAGTTDLTWDTEGKLDALDRTGDEADTTYVYDADGNQLIRHNKGRTTLNLPTDQVTLEGDRLSNVRTFAAPGGLTLTRVGTPVNGTSLLVQSADHHGTGSVQIGLDSTQAVTRRATDPFGTPRGTQPPAPSWAGDKGFVGGSKDDTTGLTNLGARQYDPGRGRFISTDPLLNPEDPQQWNGYAYSNNNPVNQSDPSGLISYDQDTGVAAGGNAQQTQQAVNTIRSKPGYRDPQPVTSGGGSKGYSPNDCRHTNSCLTTLQDRTMNSFLNAVELSFNHEIVRNSSNTSTADINRVMQKYNHGASTVQYAAIQMYLFGATEEETAFFYENPCLFIECYAGLDIFESPNGNIYVSPFGLSPSEKFGANVGASMGGRTPGGRPGKAGGAANRGPSGLSALAQCFRDKHSFTADTLVSVEGGGTKRIADIETGDKVLATDPQTGETSYRTVTAVIVTRDDKQFTDLTIEGPPNEAPRTLTTTEHHPFWSVAEARWVDATALRPGDHLRRPDGTTAKVTATRDHHREATTYDLTVAGLHTYYVVAGETPVLVHNNGPGCGSIWIDSNKIPHHFKHAEDFGIIGKESKATKQAFVNALKSFVGNPGNLQIAGTYRGTAARHYVDTNTGRHVSVDIESGQMLGAWRSDPTSDQFRYLIEQGKL